MLYLCLFSMVIFNYISDYYYLLLPFELFTDLVYYDKDIMYTVKKGFIFHFCYINQL